MERLVDIAKRRLNQHKLGTVSEASHVLYLAGQLLRGHFTEMPQAARPLKLEHATLWIGAENPSVAQEIKGLSTKLLGQLQNQFGSKRIQRIQIKGLTNI